MGMEVDVLHEKLCYDVMGAAIEVHRELGTGLLERAYHRCLCRELDLRGIGYESKVKVPLVYKGTDVGVCYEADLVVEGLVVLELKAIRTIEPSCVSQLMTYMGLLGAPVGYVLNFNAERLMTKGQGYVRRVR